MMLIYQASHTLTTRYNVNGIMTPEELNSDNNDNNNNNNNNNS